MATDPQLVLLLEAKLDKFEKQLNEAGLIAKKQAKQIEDNFSKINPKLGFAGEMLKGAAAAFTLDKAINAVLNSISNVAKIGDVAERVGMTAEAFQELRFAIISTGGDANVAASGIETFAQNLEKAAAGSGYLGKILRANGVAISEDMNVNLANMAELIKNAGTETRQLALAQAAFGTGPGKEFVAALKGGADELNKFGEEGRKAGAIIRNDVVKSAQDLDTQWKKLKATLEAKLQGNIVDMVPKIQAYLEKLEEWAQKVLPILKAINQFNPAQWAIDAAGLPGFDGAGDGPMATGPKKKTQVTVFGGSGSTVLPPRGGGGGGPDSFQRAIESAQKRIEVMNAETAAINLGAAAQDRARIVIELETAAKEANSKAGMTNTEVTAAQRVQIDKIADSYMAAAQAAKDAKNPLAEFGREARDVTLHLQEAGVSALKGFEDALIGVARGTTTAAEAFKKMADAIINDLARIAIRAAITGPIATALGVPGAGGLFSMFGRAGGGPVNSKQPYMVGEHGPELFVPQSAGRIVPNISTSKGGAGPSLVVSNTYHFDAGIGPADMALIRAQIIASEQRTKSDVVGIVRGALIKDSDALRR